MQPIPKVSELSLEQKIGQLFCIKFRPNQLDLIEKLVKEYHIGSIFLPRLFPKEFVSVIKKLQSQTSIPLLVSADIEPGYGIPGTTYSVSAMGVSATDSQEMAYQTGLFYGKEARALGINWGYTPVVDVNSNPKNPIINTRSFGDTAENVIKFVRPYIKGLTEAGVLATAKHFPGHGNTSKDSHLDCVTSDTSEEDFFVVDLAPYTEMIDIIPTIMSAHVVFPHLDDKMATFSAKILRDLLRQKLKFNGIVVTDSLSMGAVKKHYSAQEAVIESLLAGCDIALRKAQGTLEIVNKIKKMVDKGTFTEELIDEAVIRVLSAKEKVFSRSYDEDFRDLTIKHIAIAQKIAEKSLTPIGDVQQLVLDANKIKNGLSVFAIGHNRRAARSLLTGLEEKAYQWRVPFTCSQELKETTNSSHTVIVAIYSTVRFYSNEIGISKEESEWLQKIIARHSQVIIVICGNPYMLRDIPPVTSGILAYDFTEQTTRAIVSALCGEIEISGKLPICVE